MNKWSYSIGSILLTRENEVLEEKLSQCQFFAINPTWTSQGLNPGLRCAMAQPKHCVLHIVGKICRIKPCYNSKNRGAYCYRNPYNNMHFYPSAQCFCGLFCWSTRIIQPVWEKRTRPSKYVSICHKLSIQQHEVLQHFTLITRGRDLSQITYTY